MESIPHSKMLVNVALLVFFMGTAWTDVILNKSGRLRSLPYNCVEAVCAAGSEAKSGIYQIRLPLDGWAHRPFYVYCLLDDKGGDPWLLVQRRQDGEVNFYRNWNDYKAGFGSLDTSFFIGLDKLHALTQVQLNELQIVLHDFDDTVKYANFKSFAVGDENEKYALNILGDFSGSAGNGTLYYNSGQKFSTYDMVNNFKPGRENCAKYYKGAWWFRGCFWSHLNGVYINGTIRNGEKGIIWNTWRGVNYSLKYAHMAIRPIDSTEMRVHGCRKKRHEKHQCRKRKNRTHSYKNTTNKD